MRFTVSVLCIHAVVFSAMFCSGVSLAEPISRVSVSSDGIQSNSSSFLPKLSSDGRFVVFHSNSANLVANDTNGVQDVFLRDRQNNTTTRVSVTSAGNQISTNSEYSDVSDDGRYVVFHSKNPFIVPGDTNGYYDIFLRDRQNNTTTRISVDSVGTQAVGGDSQCPVISSDGRFVVFHSKATNLVAGDTNGILDIFLHNISTGQTTRVSVDSAGNQADNLSLKPDISSDGRYVVFYSIAANLVAGDTNGNTDIFLHDTSTGQTTRVSVTSAGNQASSSSTTPKISSDGRYITFLSSSSDLVPGDTNGAQDVFLHDTSTGQTERVSLGAAGQQGNNDSLNSSISNDGRYVVFTSVATNLVAGDTNGEWDVFARDRINKTTTRVSVDLNDVEGDNMSNQSEISGDGTIVVFSSAAANLVAGDTNFRQDIFATGAFYTPPAPPAPKIPTMTEWGMIIMAALMAVTALVMRKRVKA